MQTRNTFHRKKYCDVLKVTAPVEAGRMVIKVNYLDNHDKSYASPPQYLSGWQTLTYDKTDWKAQSPRRWLHEQWLPCGPNVLQAKLAQRACCLDHAIQMEQLASRSFVVPSSRFLRFGK